MIEGTIGEFRWINPHASFVIEGRGSDRSWTVEMNAPNVLMGQGWKRDSLAVGDKVTGFVSPLRVDAAPAGNGRSRALYVGIILADGATLGSVSQDDGD